MIKKISFLLATIIVGKLISVPAHAAIIFQDDVFATVASDGIIIDSSADAPGDIVLQFGGFIAETLKWSVSNSRFELSDDLDLGNNLLSTFRIENITALPGGAGGLGPSGTGRSVQLTVTDTIAPGCTVAPNCFPGTYTWNGSAWNVLSGPVNTQYAQTVTVAESGADFTSIKSAVDSITDASAIKPYVVRVFPGTYTESPITLPDFVSVTGVGDFSNTIVTAASTTGTLFEMGLTSTIRYMTLQGASGAGGKCIRAAKSSGALNVRLNNCETGILATGPTTGFQASTIVVNSGTFTDIIKVDGGAQMGLTTYSVAAATAANGIVASGTNTGLTVANAGIRSALITNGIYLNDSAKATIGNVTVQLAQNGLRIGPTGTSTVNGSGGVITNNSIYNIFAETATAKIYYSGLVANKNKFNIPIGATRVITFNDDTADDEALNVLGEMNVGIPEHPTESLFGEGDSYTSGILVYTFNGSTYTNVTTAAQDTTTTFTFPSTAVNDAIYISSDRKDVASNFVKFGGFRSLSSTTAALGGSIVPEYWNGSSWTQFNTMCFHATLLYRYDSSCYTRANSDEYVIFNDAVKDTWALNDPPTTGTNRYWIRLRIATTLTTAPVFQQFKVNPNSTQINEDGTFTFLGDARHRKTFITGPDMIFFGQGSNTPANAAFTVGSGATSWTVERLLSSFNGVASSIEEVSGSIALPRGIDTSNGLKAKIYWKKANAATGTVEWKLDYLVSGAQNVTSVNGSNIATSPRAASEDIDGVASTTIQTTTAGNSLASDAIMVSEFTTDININTHYEGDVLFLRLYRDPADADDTYNHDAIMVGFEVSGVFWTLGEKL